MRLVLDTNVVVSALLWGGQPEKLIILAAEGEIELFSSPVLLDELAEVIARPHLAARLGGKRQTVDEARGLYAALVQLVTPIQIPRVVADDPDDDHVIAAAIAANARLIVSGDRHLLGLGSYRGIPIDTPAQALTRILGQRERVT